MSYNVWESDEGRSYLTKEGLAALRNYSKRQDIFRVHCMMQLFQAELEKLNVNDVVVGPSFGLKLDERKKKQNLFKLTPQREFIQIAYNEENVKLIHPQLKIHDYSWFSWKKILYFSSWNLNKIEELSVYYTKEGEDYLLKKRKSYLFVRNHPDLFGPNQIKAFKQIPRGKEWW